MRTIAGFVIAFLSSLALLGQVSGETASIAAGLALMTLLWWLLLRTAARSPIRPPRAGQAGAWARAIGALPRDTLRVGAALARSFGTGASDWRAAALPFRFGAIADPGERGRRAVAVVAGSLTPDRIVVDVQSDRATAAAHQLAGSGGASREWVS